MRRFSPHRRVSVNTLLVLPLLLKVLHVQSNCSDCGFKAKTASTTEIAITVAPFCTLTNVNNTQKINSTITVSGLTPGNIYTFNLACNSGNCCVPLATTPDVIRSLYVAEVTTSSVFLNWSDSQGYHSFYKVQWNNNNEVKSVSKTSAPVNISNLTATTAYTFTITAVAADNLTEGAAVNITQFTRPDVITKLSTTAVNTSSVSLTWSPPLGNIPFYRVQCNSNNVFQNQTTNLSSITIVNLLPGVQYTFSVIAVAGDNKTEGAPISLYQFTRPDVITNISVSQITTSSLSLTWSAPQGVISFYIVQWNYNETKNQTVNSAYINIQNLLPDVQYTFSVTAVAGDNKTRGVPVSLSQFTRPDVITNISVSQITTSSLSLTWSAPQGVISFYIVQWNYNETKNQTVNSAYINIQNLLPAVQYTFSVTAVAGDNKTRGVPVSLSQFTRPDVITNLSVSQITTSSLSLTWSAPQGVISFYIVQWNYNETKNQTVNSAYINIQNLLPGVQYTFSVTAVAGDNKTRGVPVSLSQFTKPAKPGNISSINPGNSNLTIYWSPPQGNVVWYEVNVANYSFNVTLNFTSSTNYITLLGLSAGIIYNVTVTAVSGPFRNTSDVVQLATKSNPPSNIRVQEKTNSSVSLVWDRPLMDASVNVTFNITYMPNQGGITQPIASSQNHIQLTDLVSGTQYYFCVAAVGSQGLSSSVVCRSEYTSPNPVQNLKASSVSISSIRLDWGSPAGLQPYYMYQVQITNASGLVGNLTVAQNYTEILNLAPGSRYNATVTTIASSDAYSASQVTICQTKPKPVGNLIAMAVSTTTINLTWTSQDYDQGSYLYLVFICQSDLGTQNTNTTDKSFSFSNLIPGTRYNFTVTAVVNGVLSDMATAFNFTKPEKARNIMAVGTTSSLTVTWDRPNGNYEFVTITVYSNSSVTATQSVPSNNSAVFTNLRPGQLYNLTLSTNSGPFQVDSDMIQNATYPNPPSSIKVEQQTTNSVNISWDRPVDMDVRQYDFIVYLQGNKTRSSNNWINLGNLTSATGYNISVVTVGPMAYKSTPVALQVFTLPKSISQLYASEITTSNVTLVWQQPDSRDVYEYLITVANMSVSLVTRNTSANIGGLQSGSNYTFSVIAQGHSGFNASAMFTSLFTRPYPIGPVDSNALNTTAVYLNWTRPLEYQHGYSYRVEISGCLLGVKNQSVQTEVAHITGLIPGTNCFFSIYSQAANGIEGTPVTTYKYTMPEKVVPHISNGGTNHSIAVEWDSPRGNVEKYVVSLRSPQGGAVYQELTSSAQSCLFANLTAGSVYTVTVETFSGPLSEQSNPVSYATYPNKPGHITVQNKTTNTISLEWMDAPGMDNGNFTYMVTYQSAESMETRNVTRNTADLSSLDSGTSYNISVATVGPMGLVSETVAVFLVTTKPEQVEFLNIYSTSAEEVVLTWSKPIDFKSGYLYRVVTTYGTNSMMNTTTSTENYTAAHLMPGTQYTFMVSTLTWDGTESSNVLVSSCTDAVPVLDLTCQGPDLTAAVLTLSWSNPKGLNKGFEVQVMDNVKESIPTCDPTCKHNVTGLSYNTQYSVSLQTQGCGKSSTVTEIPCKTGITVPPIPDAETHVKVTEVEFDKFTLELNSSLFNYTNGPIVNYAILVTSNMNSVRGQSLSSLTKYLNKTYEDWAAGQISTYLAVVKDNMGTSRNSNNSVVVIGDSAKWQSYSNGPLKARGVYSFAVVMFTRLEEKDGLVDISASYVSISSFYQSAISVPENPVVIASIAGVVSCLLILFVFIAAAVIFFKRRARPENLEVPIHSLRAKVSVPIKVENFEEYFRKQHANSNCGFAEEFENLKPVGVAQAKSSALALENKGKNRYNNVLPYDCSRVKLSVQGSPYDDYINANYMPGYNSRKEFIAAQGPLPSTVNEFWRMIWEKNVRTLVMLTRCNEQGRVKCEEYWPSTTKHFNNITVTTTSELVLEDWTIREFNVKNVKTAENRNLRQFHFTAWPDHGVPETTELLINFRHLVREHMDEFSRNSPTVVHCSAGVGRTGTFIAIDRLIFQIERDGMVDVFGIIHDLRMHRTLMVQTEDQYVFLNQCAMDIIKARTGTNVDLIYQNTAALSIYENFEPSKSKHGYHHA